MSQEEHAGESVPLPPSKPSTPTVPRRSGSPALSQSRWERTVESAGSPRRTRTGTRTSSPYRSPTRTRGSSLLPSPDEIAAYRQRLPLKKFPGLAALSDAELADVIVKSRGGTDPAKSPVDLFRKTVFKPRHRGPDASASLKSLETDPTTVATFGFTTNSSPLRGLHLRRTLAASNKSVGKTVLTGTGRSTRPAFVPCNPYAAKMEVTRALDEFVSVDTPYSRAHESFVHDQSMDLHRAPAAFWPSCASQARESIRLDVYINSPDERQKMTDKLQTRERALTQRSLTKSTVLERRGKMLVESSRSEKFPFPTALLPVPRSFVD